MNQIMDADPAQVRVRHDGPNRRTVVGYAAVFNRDSAVMRTASGQKFIERILPGAFSEELKRPDLQVRATVLHDQDKILGRYERGTVKLAEDSVGLRAEIYVPNSSLGNDAIEAVDRSDLDKMSFGFTGADGTTDPGDNGIYRRTISRIKGFHEITLADNRAAYSDTSVSVRFRMAAAAVEAFARDRDFKLTPQQQADAINCLANAGFRSAAELRAIASAVLARFSAKAGG